MERINIRTGIIILVCFQFLSCDFSSEASKKRPNFDSDSSITKVSKKKQCQKFTQCLQACEKVYQYPREVQQCKKLSVDEVEYLYFANELLKNPSNRLLRQLSEKDLQIYLTVGIETFLNHIEKYAPVEARRVLTWITEDKKIAEVLFSVSDENYRRVFLELFTSAEPIVPEYTLHRNLFDGLTFFSISNENNNNYAIYMVHQVIREDFCRARATRFVSQNPLEQRETCILRVYCHKRGNSYIHQNNFRYISNEISDNADIFNYIQDESQYGLGKQKQHTITPNICNQVCDLIPKSCE